MLSHPLLALLADREAFSDGRFTTRTPPFLFYLFAFGWCVHFADSQRRRLLLTVAAPLMFFTVGELSYAAWLTLGSWAVLWLRPVGLPRLAQRLVTTIAASVFPIFVFHMLPVQALRVFWPEPRPLLVNLAAVVFAVGFGVVGKFIMDWTARLISRALAVAGRRKLVAKPQVTE